MRVSFLLFLRLIVCTLVICPNDVPAIDRTPFDELFVRGDCNVDSAVNIADPLFLLNWKFLGGPVSSCKDACDANDDGTVDISDAIYKLNWLFIDGAEPPPPGQTCGVDPTADELDCARFVPCEV